MPAKVHFDVVAGPIAGQVFTFERFAHFLFGRSPDCQARLPDDPHVSRFHFLAEIQPPDVRVRDLGSRNGTLVNGVKYGGRRPDERRDRACGRRHPQVDLNDGDEIRVGGTCMKVRIERPVVCAACGVESPSATAAAVEGGLCAACRLRQATRPPSPRPQSSLRCQECGKDATTEERRGGGGDYICEACRQAIFSRPAAAGKLLRSADPGAKSPTSPQIAGYELLDYCQKGGMGAVYRARRTRDGALVAVKVMLARVAVDPIARGHFLREVEVLGALEHPHVVRFHECGSVGGGFYFVMDYCTGGNLKDLVRREGGRLSIDDAVRYWVDCLQALAYVHERGFVHRDVKPQNILLDAGPRGPVAKVSDFGLSKSFQDAGLTGLTDLTATGAYGGTLAYMPREQLIDYKRIGPESDLWSLAASVYWALCGRLPMDFGDGRDEISVLLNDEPAPIRSRLPETPGALAEVIDRSLLVDAARRFRSAKETIAAIDRARSV